MSIQHQSNEKFLVFKNQRVQDKFQPDSLLYAKKCYTILNDKFFLMDEEHDEKHWRFEVFDLFMNESRLITFPRQDQRFELDLIVMLNDNIGFIVENLDNNYSVNLVCLDWLSGEFHLIHLSTHQSNDLNIFMNRQEQEKFMLYTRRGEHVHCYQACELIKNKIVFGETFYSSTYYWHYSKDKLVSCANSEIEYTVNTLDWKLKKEQIFKIGPMPENIKLVSFDNNLWVQDRMHVIAHYEKTDTYGIAWSDLKALRWNFTEFETALSIQDLLLFNGKLVVLAKADNIKNGILDSELKFFSIPIRRPQSLRELAWRSTITKFERSGSKNPYESASDFLPLNSDLREPWFEENDTDLEGLSSQQNQDQCEASTGKQRRPSQFVDDEFSTKRPKWY